MDQVTQKLLLAGLLHHIRKFYQIIKKSPKLELIDLTFEQTEYRKNIKSK